MQENECSTVSACVTSDPMGQTDTDQLPVMPYGSYNGRGVFEDIEESDQFFEGKSKIHNGNMWAKSQSKNRILLCREAWEEEHFK